MRLWLCAALCFSSVASARQAPEDLLKGRLIISDKSLPMRWNSVSSYVSQMRGLSKGTIWYDKKTGKATLQYAAFFAQPVSDVQVSIVFYDITDGARTQKSSTEAFMTRGERVLFSSITVDKEDLAGNRKYMVTIEDRRRIIASGQVILRMEGPHYSGRVQFSDEDTKE